MKRLIRHIIICCVLAVLVHPNVIGQVEIPEEIAMQVKARIGLNKWNQLQCTHKLTSLTGEHYTCVQKVDGIRVYGSFIKFHVFKNEIVWWKARFAENSIDNFQFSEYSDEPLQMVKGNDSIVQREYVWFQHENELIPAFRIAVVGGYNRAMEYIFDNQMNILDSLDYICYYDVPQDTTANAMVFLPDPLTSSGNSYGGPYVDSGDMNLAALNAERTLVQIPVTYDTGYFHLMNDHILITNHNDPNYSPAKVVNGNFDFNRADQGFEDVNVFYHINVYQEHLQDLGFDLVNYQIHAETHASQSDNSTFNSLHSPPRLSFGEGGVDDGEDADVIIHEYGHAISHSAAPGTNTGMERRSIDEGIGDYLAASYSRNINPFRWDDVFTWDGHNEFFSGRSASTNKIYPQDLSGSNIHANGEIWSSALMELWEDIGGDVTDRILFESLYDYFLGMDMNQAARLYILADSLLHNGMHYNSICDVFNNRGFSTSCNNYNSIDEWHANKALQVKGSMEFLNGGEVQIYAEQSNIGKVYVFNSTGQLHRQYELNSNAFNLSSRNLASGTYFLKVMLSDDSLETILLVKK